MWPFKKKMSVPSEFELEQAHSATEFTPDIVQLEGRARWLFFVYDRWKDGHADHSIFGGEAMNMGVVFTQDNFAMIKRSLGQDSYPIPLDRAPFNLPEAPIRGELYAVPSGWINRLDTDKRNGVKFERRRVSVTLPYRGMRNISMVKYQSLRAFMYVGIQDFWEPLVDKDFFLFDKVRTFEPKNTKFKEYYEFTKLEYDVS